MSDVEHDDLDFSRRPRGIRVIAWWLVFSILPGAGWSFQQGLDIVLSPTAAIIWAYNLVALICGLGLFFRKEWARNGAVWLFSAYFVWTLYTVKVLIGPFLQHFSLWLADFGYLSAATLQNVLFVLLMTHMIWPVVAIFYLTYPGVKIAFQERERIV